MTAQPLLTVVVAVQHAEANLPDILRALAPARHPEVEFIVSRAGAGSLEAVAGRDAQNLRVLEAQPDSLIPHLWRDGIRAARAERVAVTTAHCVPAADWVERLLKCDLDTYAGVGGVVENDPASDGRGWAVYLLRYISFAPPQKAREVAEIAADNAVYRRGEILQHEDLLENGFWEPSFHARFRAEGLPLALDPALRVVHRNLYTARAFMGQRWEHGLEFGLARARASGPARRFLLAALSPLIPAVFFAKLCRRILGKQSTRGSFLRALPWLVLFMLSWNGGEILGYFINVLKGKMLNS